MKAIILGATGLVGNLILKDVLADNDFSEVRIFVRRPTGIINSRLIEIVNPLKDISVLSSEIQGDVLFNALGTTIKNAGSQKEQQRIDRDLPLDFAKIASENGVKLMLNISSVGASLKGGFYLKTKAEMEIGTGKFYPGSTYNFRPGFLAGKRKEFRFTEKIASVIMKGINPFLTGSFTKFKSMPVEKLSKAMISLSKSPEGKPAVLHFTEIMQCI
jgi:uncharacterized protein YbjT (DUF2867 family)